MNANAARVANAPAEERATPRDGFFAHHGVWAVGVRLFRRLNFGAKAWLISLAFVVPLLLLSGAYYRTSQRMLDFAHGELAGVEMVQALEPWLIAAQKERRLVLSGMTPRVDLGAIDKAGERFQQLSKALPKDIDLREGLSAVDGARAALVQGGLEAGSAQLQARLQRLVDELVKLRNLTLSASGLTLDPGQDTYNLINLSGSLISDVIESISRSRATSGGMQGEATPAAVRQLYGVWIQGLEGIDLVRNAARHAGDVNSQVSETLAVDRAAKAAQAFFAAAEHRWFGDEFKADVEGLNPVGQTAVDEMRALSARSTSLLKELLERRIAETQEARRVIVAVTAVCLLVAAYLFVSFYLVMRGGLREVGRHLEAMTAGDLTTRPSPWGHRRGRPVDATPGHHAGQSAGHGGAGARIVAGHGLGEFRDCCRIDRSVRAHRTGRRESGRVHVRHGADRRHGADDGGQH